MANAIYEAIKGRSEKGAASLADIIGAVDYYERVIFSCEELENGLRDLIQHGKIAEISKHKFVDAKGQSYPRTFSGVTEDEWEQAYKQYSREFNEVAAKVNAELDAEEAEGRVLSREKIIVRWARTDDYARDEAKTEKLAEQLETALTHRGLATTGGFDISKKYIDIPIFGKESDTDTDMIYRDIADIVRAFGCPCGSCIVRRYHDQNREVISDTIS